MRIHHQVVGNEVMLSMPTSDEYPKTALYVISNDLNWAVWLVEVHELSERKLPGLREGLRGKCKKIRLLWSFLEPSPHREGRVEPEFVTISRAHLAFNDEEFRKLFEQGRMGAAERARGFLGWAQRRQKELAEEMERAKESERAAEALLKRIGGLPDPTCS